MHKNSPVANVIFTEIATTEHNVSKALSTTLNQWCNKAVSNLFIGIKQKISLKFSTTDCTINASTVFAGLPSVVKPIKLPSLYCMR